MRAAQGHPLEGTPLEGTPLEGSPLEGSPLEGSPLEEDAAGGGRRWRRTPLEDAAGG